MSNLIICNSCCSETVESEPQALALGGAPFAMNQCKDCHKLNTLFELTSDAKVLIAKDFTADLITGGYKDFKKFIDEQVNPHLEAHQGYKK